MVIYVESVLAFNFLLDYLLLFGAARLAGRHYSCCSRSR